MAQPNALRLRKESQESLVQYACTVLEIHKRKTEYRTKMEYIDVAYARYKTEQNTNPGDDRSGAAAQPCGVNVNDITVPIVVSQVDSYVGYFADIYLSGFPTFPVTSTFDNREAAEKLEAIVDDHSVRGRYPRHMLMSFRDAAKYNLSALEIDWAPLDLYNVTDALSQLNNSTAKGQNKLAAQSYYHNAMNRIDPYNLIWDDRVQPVDVPYIGEYAGHIGLPSRIQLKRKLAYYGASGDGYNTSQALVKGNLGKSSTAASFEYYTAAPDISELVSKKDMHQVGLTDWVAYMGGRPQKSGQQRVADMSDIYEHLCLYVRIIPNEHMMDNVPNPGTPQVWKLCFVNHKVLVYAKRIYSLYDMIPMFFSQPFEDGFGMQTRSLAENGIPFQQAASDLFSIRLNSARRAVVDRAIYDPKMLNSSDVNAPYPSAKIPLRDGQTLSGKKLEDAYKQIPFDSRGTETVVQDMGQIVSMADNMNGINQATRGQHVKGNKTRKQWEDTQEGAQNRMRLPALSIEYQQMVPIKEQIKLNIYQYGVEGTFQDQTNGKMYEIDRAELDKIRSSIGSFKLADGFTPAEKLASTDVIQEGMGMISQSPILQQQLGPMLPKMFIHLMSLGGVKGLEQYMPQQQQPQPQPQQQQQAGGPQGQQAPVAGA